MASMNKVVDAVNSLNKRTFRYYSGNVREIYVDRPEIGRYRLWQVLDEENKRIAAEVAAQDARKAAKKFNLLANLDTNPHYTPPEQQQAIQ